MSDLELTGGIEQRALIEHAEHRVAFDAEIYMLYAGCDYFTAFFMLQSGVADRDPKWIIFLGAALTVLEYQRY